MVKEGHKPGTDRISGSGRKSRLAEQLRANLKKRKALQRARAQEDAPSASGPDPCDKDDTSR